MKNPVRFLRWMSFADGISYLVLLGVAMPLKYLAGQPWAVRLVGSIHGLLFITLCLALLQVLVRSRWPFLRAVLVFVASLVPFAPLWLDRRFAVWEGRDTGGVW